jgi:hypothetical protein
MDNNKRERLKSIVNNRIGFYAIKQPNYIKSDKELEIINRYDSNSDSNSERNEDSGWESKKQKKKLFSRKELELKTDMLSYTEADQRQVKSSNIKANEMDLMGFNEENDNEEAENQLKIEEERIINLRENASKNIPKPSYFMKLTQPLSKKQLSVKNNFKYLDFSSSNNLKNMKLMAIKFLKEIMIKLMCIISKNTLKIKNLIFQLIK